MRHRLASAVIAGATVLSSVLLIGAPSASAAAPAAPTSFVGSSTPGTTTIALSWVNPVASITEMKLERAIDGGAWSRVTPPGFTGSSYTDSGLMDGSYQYQISAFDNAEGSSPVPLSGAITIGTNAPMAPSVVASGTPGSSTANLAWNIPSAGSWPITGFLIQKSVGGGGWSTVQTSGAATTSLAVTNLADGVYSFQVAAVNAAGTGFFGVSSNVTVGTTTPAAPTLVAQGTPGTSTVDLVWNIPSAGSWPILNFVIERSLNSGAWSTVQTTGASTTSYSVTGLADGSYSFRISAVNAAGSSAYGTSNSVTVSVPSPAPEPPAPAPSPETSPSASAGVPVPAPSGAAAPAAPVNPPSALPSVRAPATSGHVPGLVVVTGTDRSKAQVIASSQPAGRNLAQAPVVDVTSARAFILGVNGLPSNARMSVTLSTVVNTRVKTAAWERVGTVRISPRGTTRLPALRLAKAGTYVVRMASAGAGSRYLKIVVSRRS